MVYQQKKYCCKPQDKIFYDTEAKGMRCIKPDGTKVKPKVVITLYSWLTVIFYIAMLVMNGLAEILPLNGLTTGAISDSYPNYFTPTGLTFAIWGVIYLLLGVYTIYQTQYAGDSILQSFDLAFIMSCMLNIGWIVLWHYLNLLFSTIIMILLFVILTVIYALSHFEMKGLYTKDHSWMVTVPFSVYYAWICVATVAQITIALKQSGWTGFGLTEPYWMVIMLVVLTIITILVTSIKGDLFYASVVIWAIIGIIIKRVADTIDPQPIIVTVAIIGIVLITLNVMLTAYRNLRKIQLWCKLP